MKKILVFIVFSFFIVSFAGCIIYTPEDQETVEIEEEVTTQDRAAIYYIELQNVDAGQYYPLDVGEKFYLYVKPLYLYLNGNEMLRPEDISLMSLNDADAIEIKFINICENGAYLYEITTVREGNCDLFGIDYTKNVESAKIYLSIRDYDNTEIKYRITNIDNVFHKTDCEIYWKYDLPNRMVISDDRKTLRNKGFVPCEECCS